MRWLKAAIARLRRTLSPATVTPTSSAGLARPEPTPSLGSKPTVPAMSLQPQSNLPRQPVKPAPRVSKVPALPIPQGLLPESDKAPALTPTDSPSGASGKPKAIAPRTRQPAKPAAKAKPKAAKPGSSGKKTTRAKASAPTRTAKRSGVNGTL
jgi:hypothetical protein